MGARRWLVTGASGQLAGYVLRQLAGEGDSSGLRGLTREGKELVVGVLGAG